MDNRIEELRQAIKDAQIEIEAIRKVCTHKSQTEGLYSWRPGCIDYHMICDNCGHIGEYRRPWQPPVYIYNMEHYRRNEWTPDKQTDNEE